MDRTREWQRLTAHYGAMGDEELQELAEAYDSLTELAQEILRDELRKRKLPEPCLNQAEDTTPPRTCGACRPSPRPHRTQDRKNPPCSANTAGRSRCVNSPPPRMRGWQTRRSRKRGSRVGCRCRAGRPTQPFPACRSRPTIWSVRRRCYQSRYRSKFDRRQRPTWRTSRRRNVPAVMTPIRCSRAAIPSIDGAARPAATPGKKKWSPRSDRSPPRAGDALAFYYQQESQIQSRHQCSFKQRKGHPATGRPLLLGRIVPTEAKPSELSGEIVWSAKRGVKTKSGRPVSCPCNGT